MNVQYTECSDAMLPQVREFFGRVYRSGYVLAADDALLRWQFGGVQRDDSRYHIKLAIVDGAIAGCLGYIPAEVSVAGRRLRGAWTANWIVDSAVPQPAVGVRLMSALVREHDLTLVVGASAQARDILPRMGFTAFGDLRRHICVIEPNGAATLTDSEPSVWQCAETLAITTPATAGVVRVDAFSPRIDQVWDSVWGCRGAGTRRSAAYLNWRYAAHPRFTYRLFTSGPYQRPTGFAVYRVEPVNDRRVRVGRLVEFVAEPAATDALLAAIALDACSRGLALLDYFCATDDLAPALAQRGWIREAAVPVAVPVLLQPLTAGRRGIPFLGHVRKAGASLDVDSWYVTKGDGDADRPN